MITFLEEQLHEKRPDYVIPKIGGVSYNHNTADVLALSLFRYFHCRGHRQLEAPQTI
jgi:hypothetical protein